MGKIGRPRGSGRIKPMKKTKGLRLKYYADMPSSMGGVISGCADQYGRILVEYINEDNQIDVKPNGHTIAATH